MAFPTSGLTNNQVHKEGNRAFVYDSALGVWDQVEDLTSFHSKILSGTIGSAVTFPVGHVIQTLQAVKNDENSAETTSDSYARVPDGSSNLEFGGTITGVLASSWVLITMSFSYHLEKNSTTDIGCGFGFFKEAAALFTPKNHNIYRYVSSLTSSRDFRDHISISYIDTSPATGTNNYYLGYRAYGSSTVKVTSVSTHEPFVCILQEIAQ